MKTRLFFVCLALVSSFFCANAQDTFSIEAVDSATGEIGSAGASCLGYTRPVIMYGALIISDVIPGIGACHTQAQWDPSNQQSAHSQMLSGSKPKEMIASLTANDASGDSGIRQYGIVEYNGGHPLAAAYTGSGCSDYKNHIIGKYYTIQGNILLGRKVLDTMEYGFLHTKGTLADRLMGALQAAKMPGADTRCFAHNTSSLSSFLRIAKPDDDPAKLYIDLYMSYDNNVTGNLAVDPIDSLQHMYSRNKAAGMYNAVPAPKLARLYYEHKNAMLDLSTFKQLNNLEIVLYDIQGRLIYRRPITQAVFAVFENDKNPSGYYTYRILKSGQEMESAKVLK